MDYNEKTLYRKQMYKGNVVSIDSVGVLLPNGKEATRDVVVHPGAAVVVPFSENNEIYMVRQFRKPIDKVLLEVPAGKLDKGEAPLDCAIRELKEETGLTAKNYTHLISIYTAPGFTDEIIHLYMARDLSEGETDTDADEFLSVEKIPILDLMKMIESQEITDAKSIIGIYMTDKIIKGELQR